MLAIQRPTRSGRVLPWSEKGERPCLNKRRTRSYAGVGKIYGENKSPTRNIVKRSLCSFAIVPQTAEGTARACGKGLVKMEKALNLCTEDVNRHRVLTDDDNVLCRTALSPQEDSARGRLEGGHRALAVSKGWLLRSRSRVSVSRLTSPQEEEGPVRCSEISWETAVTELLLHSTIITVLFYYHIVFPLLIPYCAQFINWTSS